MSHFDRYVEQIEARSVRPQTMLLALGEQVADLARLYTMLAAGGDRHYDPAGIRDLAQESAAILRHVQQTIDMHALGHRGDPPLDITDDEAEMLLFQKAEPS